MPSEVDHATGHATRPRRDIALHAAAPPIDAPIPPPAAPTRGARTHALIGFLSQHPASAWGLVFAAALLEAVAVIGTIVPGSSVVFAAGVLVGIGALDAVPIALAAVAGAIAGDGISYAVGRRYGATIIERWPSWAHPEWLARGQAYFAQGGGKSVFMGRFLGPLRAIVPVVAGMSAMPPLKFTAVNMLSALAWAAAHLLPGALFGASLQLAGAVSARLLILLVVLVGGGWLLTAVVRTSWRVTAGFLEHRRSQALVWAQATQGPVQRVVLSLLDPRRSDALGLAASAVVLLGAAWCFLLIFEDVLTNAPLVRLDGVVFAALQRLRTPWGDAVMIVGTEIGSAPVAIAVIAAVSAVLALARSWRTLAYWLTAVGFAEAVVWILKSAVGRARPMAMYHGVEQFSFPSGHAATSVVLWGFFAVLLTRGVGPRARVAVVVAATLLIGFVSFSRVYLGAHWLSDVLASLSLGAAWIALLNLAQSRHATEERVPTVALSSVALGALVIAGAVVGWTEHARDVAQYARPPREASTLLADWSTGGWQRLPSNRTEIDGNGEEPFAVQWATTSERITTELKSAGWHAPTPWSLRSSALWLLPTTPIGQLPLLAKFHEGALPRLSFERDLDASTRLVIRVWPSGYRVGSADGPVPIWLGMVTRERAVHPGGLVTLARTESECAGPAQMLARDVEGEGEGARIEVRQGARSPLVLIK